MTDEIKVLDKPAKTQSNGIAVTDIPEGFEINVDNWLMDKHLEWTEATQAGNGRKINELMATCINKWPYTKSAGPCNKVESYLKLTPKQWTQCVKAVGVQVNNAFLD